MSRRLRIESRVGYTGRMKCNIYALLVLNVSAVAALAGQAQRLNNVHFTEKSPLGTLANMAERHLISSPEPSPNTDYSLEEKSFELAIPSGYNAAMEDLPDTRAAVEARAVIQKLAP